MKQFIRLFSFLVIVVFLSECAKKGRPTGGEKDEDAPIFVVSNPPYKTINFKTNEIVLEFDEFVKLKDLNKQLIVSPPYKAPPLITPQSTASKKIRIKILDTLQSDTTYIYNFGDAIQDNNENNPLKNFNYVFSTGNYIDSLWHKGSISNAFESKTVEDIKLLLYKIDSNFTDSTIYKIKPNYVASTSDSSVYKFTNLRKGKYLLIGLDDASDDYIFNPRSDKIAFHKDTLVLPRDTTINKELKLYKEILPFNFKRAKELRKGQLIFGYEGNGSGLKIKLISKVPENFKSVQMKEIGKDTINYYHSKIKADSLNFIVSLDEFIDTVTVRLRKKKLDSISLDKTTKGYLEFEDTLNYVSNNPIIKVDTSKISFFDKDTLPVRFTTRLSKKSNRLDFLFNKTYENQYQLTLLPNALKDIFEYSHDTIVYNVKTRSIEDYGVIIMNVQNQNNIPLIIDLVNTKDEMIRRVFLNSSGKVEFKNLVPKEYKIRFIRDYNKNGQWDTGNYLQRIEPEKITYYEKVIKVRAFSDFIETIIIKD